MSSMMGTARFLCCGTYPDIWYARVQYTVLDILNDHELDTMIKFYPNNRLNNYNVEYAQQLPNVRIVENNLVEILKSQDFDLIITEACATTLLEILCTKSQVILFAPADFVSLKPAAAELLIKRVFFSESTECYFRTIKDVLNPGSTPEIKNIDDDFLLRYGLESINADPVMLARNHLQVIMH